MTKPKDKAKWIWIKTRRHAVDYYLRARRALVLASKPAGARLRITAFSNYALYVNGQYVGTGPAPSDVAAPRVDEYSEAELPLGRGRNVIAVLAHNPFVGTARTPHTAAGLWVQLDVAYPDGAAETIATDRQWRVARAEDFHHRAPRTFWTAGFTEVRDLRREAVGWAEVAFRDSKWAAADEVRPELPKGSGPLRLRPRETPRLAQTLVRPERVHSMGRVEMTDGVTAIPFEFTVLRASRGEFFAGTFAHVSETTKARMLFSCDEAATVFINNRQVLKQGYDEHFARWLTESEENEYSGIHRGQGFRADHVDVTLQAGWNSLGVVVYDPVAAWGFAMKFADPKTGEGLAVDFSPDQKKNDFAHWHIITEELCPFRDGVIPETPAPNARTFPDASSQLAWDRHVRDHKMAKRATALLAEPEGKGALSLADGGFVCYDFGEEEVGRLELDVSATAGAILDLASAEKATDGHVEGMRHGLRRVDRLILREGRQQVRLFNRRALRYLELVARSAGEPIEVHSVVLHATGQALAEAAPLTLDDRDLSAAVSLSMRTLERTMQDTLEGSPARDAEQSVPAAFSISMTARACLGGTPLEPAALRAFAADQDADGFFRTIVPAGIRFSAPDWNLLWIVWLADYVAWTGDKALAADLYPAVNRTLDWTSTFRNAFGMLENRTGHGPGWVFLDMGALSRRGEITAWQALYVRACQAAADVAEFLGEQAEAGHHREDARHIAETVRERLWNPARGLFIDGRLFEDLAQTSSPQTNYYALYGNLATAEMADEILSNLWKNERTEGLDWGRWDNPYTRFFALHALLEHGRADLALAMMRAYWGAMAKAGLSTVPETFRRAGHKCHVPCKAAPDGPFGGRLPPVVLCHGWGAYPPALLARWILGVRPDKPGFEQVLLAPMPGGLSRLGGVVTTPRGPVAVSIAPAGARRIVKIVVPDGLPYRLDQSHLDVTDEVEVRGGVAVENGVAVGR